MDLKRLYSLAPHSLKSVLLNAYSGALYLERYGKSFRNISEQLESTRWYSADEIKQYQDSKLRELVQHAYKNVPYYHQMFNDLGLRVADIRTVNDLKKLPVLTKADIKTNSSLLLSRVHTENSRGMKFGGTSGTTGSPLRVGWSRHMRIFNNAIDWRQKRWAGIEPGEPIVMLLGQPIIQLDKTKPPFWQEDYVQNFLWMSAFHLHADYMPMYVEKILSFGPSAVEGYPSTLFEFAKFLLRTGKKIQVKAVFCSSEPLHKHYRETIEQAFGCKVFDFYGLAERTIFATQCQEHAGQHLNFEYGISELLDEEGNDALGQEGVLVTTSLENFGMPLIRYQVSDRTMLIDEPCACGRAMPRMREVVSKYEDMIYRVDGTAISPSILTHPFKLIESIDQSQIVQLDAHNILLKIVKADGYNDSDERQLLAAFQARVGEDMKVSIEYSNHLARDPSGKFRWVVNQSISGEQLL